MSKQIISSLDTKENNNTNNLLTLIVILMFMFLNQGKVIFGANISIADFFLISASLYLIFKNKILLPFLPTLYFLIVSVFVLYNTVFLIPYKFMVNPGLSDVLEDYIKLIIVFIYFIIGYTLANLGLIEKAVKWYSIFGLLIGIIGVIFTILNLNLFSEILFVYAPRFNGLMNDPNYFSIIQVSVFVYFSRNKDLKRFYKWIILILIILSILVSGSKTGLITLLSYLTLRILESLFNWRRNPSKVITQTFLFGLLIILITISRNVIINLIGQMTSIIPVFSRVEAIFTDFNSAISGSGSARDVTWEAAMEIISSFPILGIGIGTYTSIADQLYGVEAIAHNTYLQLFSEWGILLPFILFMSILTLIIKVTFGKEAKTDLNFILRDIVIVFLLGSLAISLNNARMFWVFLGAFAFYCKSCKKNI